VVKFKKHEILLSIRGGYDNDEDGDVVIYYEGNNAGRYRTAEFVSGMKKLITRSEMQLIVRHVK
jgi:hypothetical protein